MHPKRTNFISIRPCCLVHQNTSRNYTRYCKGHWRDLDQRKKSKVEEDTDESSDFCETPNGNLILESLPETVLANLDEQIISKIYEVGNIIADNQVQVPCEKTHDLPENEINIGEYIKGVEHQDAVEKELREEEAITSDVIMTENENTGGDPDIQNVQVRAAGCVITDKR